MSKSESQPFRPHLDLVVATTSLRSKLSRILVFLIALVNVLFSSGSTVFQRWSHIWWEQRGSIALFTTVNVSITTINEMVARTIVPEPPSEGQKLQYGFFVFDPKGAVHIHRQSLVNIFMTLFASLFGGVVFFIKRQRNRYLFFIGFGLMSSLLSQSLGSIFRDGLMAIAGARLIFDLFYCGTLKYAVFEWVRWPLLKVRCDFVKVFLIRYGQDLVLTVAKVLVLNLLQFSG